MTPDLKRCTKCGEEKPATLEFFYAYPKVKRGLTSRCRACAAAVQKAYVEADPARSQKIAQDCYLRNYEQRKAELRAQNRKRMADPEKVQAERERAKAKAQRERETTPEVVNARQRAYRERHKDDPEYRERLRVRDRARYIRQKPRYLSYSAKQRAFRASVPGGWTGEDVRQMFVRQNGCCHYCGAKVGRTAGLAWHVDHVIPISRGGSNFPENLVIACEPCNRAKYNKMPWEWLPDQFSPPNS
ncbi:HNH endonuclease [Deinococcus ruber]|uniref:HNH nuclease domain-containing protein n=1 Tax=Deinococcus ruber TaxID=1848197 RepID=A0A918CQP8_9DEIO|nr:HNH endonuclease [Deinococcus ruber]GGR34019.1 hypothetical protein GCM10008957_50270 [Deinococcus ruber]